MNSQSGYSDVFGIRTTLSYLRISHRLSMKKLFTLLFAAGISSLFAQVSTPFRIPFGGVSPAADSSVDYFPSLQIIEADHSDEEANQQVKDSLSAIYRNRPQQAAQRSGNPQAAVVVPPPTIGSNFAGNAFKNSIEADGD